MSAQYKKEQNWSTLRNEQRSSKSVVPNNTDKEIELGNKVLLSITNPRGIITYCNANFVTTCGYDESELAGASHNIIRHPDMPRVIFKLMWQRIQNKNNIMAIVKNLAKNGQYYWVMTDFIIKEDSSGNIVGYKAYRKSVPKKAVEIMIPIYKSLCNIEEKKGIKASEEFLVGFLESKNTTYDEFIENLLIDSLEIKTTKDRTDKERKSFFKRFFKK